MNFSSCVKKGFVLLRKANKFNLNKNWRNIKRNFSTSNNNIDRVNLPSERLYHFENVWPEEEKCEFMRDMLVLEDFVSVEEEQCLVNEAEACMRRMRYQFDHWDDAIHGYRERENAKWRPENEAVLDRVRRRAFVADVLPDVHILDLAKDGVIKPHVDSSRYCGSTIAGLSLLTDCIMRLRRVDENMYKQGRVAEQTPMNQSNEPERRFKHFADILLKRRSLYIMKDSARYKFSHEVLITNSKFRDILVEKDRRISIICRNQA